MDTSFGCPKCQLQITADEIVVGEEIDCPECGEKFRVPPPAKPKPVPEVVKAVAAGAPTATNPVAAPAHPPDAAPALAKPRPGKQARRIALLGYPDSGKTRFLVSLNRLAGAVLGDWQVQALAPGFVSFLSYWKDRLHATGKHERRWDNVELLTMRHLKTGSEVTFVSCDFSGETIRACFDPESEPAREYTATNEGKERVAALRNQLANISGLIFMCADHVRPANGRSYEDYNLVFNGLKHIGRGGQYPVLLVLSMSDLMPRLPPPGPELWAAVQAAVAKREAGELDAPGLLDEMELVGRKALDLPSLAPLKLEQQLRGWCAASGSGLSQEWGVIPVSSFGTPEAVREVNGQLVPDLQKLQPVGIDWPFQWFLDRFEAEELATPVAEKADDIGYIFWAVVFLALLLFAALLWGIMQALSKPRAAGEETVKLATQTAVPPSLTGSSNAGALNQAQRSLSASTPTGTPVTVVWQFADGSPVSKEKPWENSLGMKFVPVSGTEVMFSIWETRVQDYSVFSGATGRRWGKPSWTQHPTHPAVNISWDDAQAFCAWLTEKERREGGLPASRSYRLPQDWEWSVAVGLIESLTKAATESPQWEYPWGTQWPPVPGGGNYHPRLGVDGYEFTSPVGSFAANRLGIFDLGGNVWEWCAVSSRGMDNLRVLRGASFLSEVSSSIRSANRLWAQPKMSDATVGLRIVLEDRGIH